MARICSVWAAGEMVVQVISLTRNVSVSIINFFGGFFPITKYFIFSFETLKDRHSILKKAKQVP